MPRKLDQPIDATMSFGDHLEELRKRILLALAPLVPLSVAAYAISNTLISALLLPLFRVLRSQNLPLHVQNLTPPEAVLTQIKLSIIVAVVISAPWILWQLWLFVRPGLYEHERRFVNLLLPGSAILTIAGVLCMYYALLPIMLHVLVAIGASIGRDIHIPPAPADPAIQGILQHTKTVDVVVVAPDHPTAGQAWLLWPDMKLQVATSSPVDGSVSVVDVPRPQTGEVTQQYRLSDYIGFVMLLFLGIVLAFQMPLVIMLLGWVGLASPQWLRQQRRYAVFACAIISVVITPGDVVSMLIMMVPLYALYELGILFLLMAPASAVIKGNVFSLSRLRKPSREQATGDGHQARTPHARSDKAREPMDQPRKSAQPDGAVAGQERSAQQAGTFPDAKEDET
jgi:Sec-independent protein secretion pathway component TatC